MIALLGGSGYVGQAFSRMFQQRGEPFKSLSRKECDYTRYEILVEYLCSERPAFLINAAGFTGKPNVDACEIDRASTLQGNTLLPLVVSHACAATKTPWAHISTGCIYQGAIVNEKGSRRTEQDLQTAAVKQLMEKDPSAIEGFKETDEPNFSFRRPPCSFYSGTKALAEEALVGDPRVYLLRMRIPFNEVDHPRNYLSKLQSYPKIYDNFNSLSHLDDFVQAALGLWRCGAPFGIYNVVNPGFVSTRQVVEIMQRILKLDRRFEFWKGDDDFYREAAIAPRSNCILNADKLIATGVNIRPVEEALDCALSNWQPQSPSTH